MHAIPVFAVNLPNRKDRRTHILREYSGFNDFSLCIVAARIHKIGAVGLWKTIQQILRESIKQDYKYIILCEDDHQFSKGFTILNLLEDIELAQSLDADIVLGGVSWFQGAVKIKNRLHWVHRFTGLQFTVIFRKFFDVIVNDGTYNNKAVDLHLSTLSKKKYVIYPYISTQKDFGYSDATIKKGNNIRVEQLFTNSSNCFEFLSKVRKFYDCNKNEDTATDEYISYQLPVFVFVDTLLPEPSWACLNQISELNEFHTHTIHLSNETNQSQGEYNRKFWESLRQAIKISKDGDDQFAIILQGDGRFSCKDAKKTLLEKIFQAHEIGIKMLSSATIGFRHVIPISKNIYWVDHFLYTPLIVIFESLFHQIIEFEFLDYMNPYEVLAELTTNKATIFPSIFEKEIFNFDYIAVPFNRSTNYEKLARTYREYLEDIQYANDHLIREEPSR